MSASQTPIAERDPFVILGARPAPAAPSRAARGLEGASPLIPAIPLEDGEQYRFHFDMTKCIGCKCCEVACAEQNNNPADVSWRRVGEVEGGSFPFTQRLHLSMGCNHCLDPACMTGCPTEAYTKDAATGVVIHDPNVCIGCEYCIWNCPYSVPAFNEERGVVGKCDMCHNRLADGDAPACVSACPSEAIQIEIVNVEQWRREYRGGANAPGLPSADDTISTTRITLPDDIPLDARKADYYRVKPEKPHWSLVFMTVVTQLSVGGFVFAWLARLLGGSQALDVAGLAALIVGLVSVAAAPLHLGRPVFAYRAMKNWRRSWLSREILALSAFGGAATGYAAGVWLEIAGVELLGAAAAVAGLAAMTATSFIYVVPGRPAWRSPHTVAEFLLTGLTLGPLFLAALGAPQPWLPAVAASGGAGQLLNQMWKFVALSRSEEFERQAAARLLANELSRPLLLRMALLVAGGVALPLLGQPLAALALALPGELLGRYLFFVSVVPKNMALTFAGRVEGAG